jgi:hypothetical protein
MYSTEITGPQFWTDDDDDKLKSPQSRGTTANQGSGGTISERMTESVG